MAFTCRCSQGGNSRRSAPSPDRRDSLVAHSPRSSCSARCSPPRPAFAQTVFSSVTLGAGNFDTTIGLNSNKTYLNAVNLTGSAITIGANGGNLGVTFAASNAGNPSDSNWSTTNWGNQLGSGQSTVTGNLGTLLNTFNYGDGSTPQTLTLTSLTAGNTYEVTFYNRDWDNAATRSQSITTTSGGSTTFQQDLAGSGGQNQGNLLRYTFVASGASETITMSPLQGGSFHLYGFSTEQVFNNTFTSGTNWSTSVWANTADGTNAIPTAAGSNAIFGSSGSPATLSLDANETVGHLQFNGTVGTTISGASTLTLQGDPGGVSMVNVVAGTHNISAPMSLANDAYVYGAGNLILSGAIAGTGALNIQGTGTLQLNGANSYSGGTNITNGILELTSLGTLGTGTITITNGGSLEFWTHPDTSTAGGDAMFIPNNIVLNGFGAGLNRGALNQDGGSGLVTIGTTSTTVTLAGDSRIGIGGGSFNNMQIDAKVTGPGRLYVQEHSQNNFDYALLLTNTNNDYSGGTVFEGGILNVASLADYGSNGSLGSRTASQDAGGDESMLFRGGTLQYTGSTPQSTNRAIRLSTFGGGGTIDASGSSPSATLSFTAATSPNWWKTAASARSCSPARTPANTMATQIQDIPGVTTIYLFKTGVGTWYLTSTNSNYTGDTVFQGGILNVASLADYGDNNNVGRSSLGNRSVGQDAGGDVGLLFRGGTLQYTGSTAQSTNRAIRINADGAGGNAGGATLDASGSNVGATLSFTATSSPNLFENGGTRTLTLTGSNTGANTFAMKIEEAGGATTLVKSGGGTWRVTNTDNTYSGDTIFQGGVLNVASLADYGNNSSLGNRSASQEAGGDEGLLFRGGTLQYTGSTPQSTNRAIRINADGAGGNAGGATLDASGSTPSATLSFTAASSPNLFEFGGSRTLTLTGSNTGSNLFALALSDAGASTSVVKSGPGTWVLSGNSSYGGATLIQGGTLRIQNSNALGVGNFDGTSLTVIMPARHWRSTAV